ncbi:MAG: tRNA-(ms[2]io[6]A)-hydroxylase [Bacteroidia bacterium]|nr:tRNA-(ms[2]io[6]A)-hydroxylase [Bacteroidia bacterium]
MPLLSPSPEGWIKSVMANFDFFLQDHADCERKASAFAMSLVAKYPNRTEILPTLIDTALEELEHFRDVYQIMEKRGIQLQHEIKEDLYVKQLLSHCKKGRDEHFLDRLILGSIIENRGAERFKIIYEHLPEGELKKFYHNLWANEAKHGEVFVRMALIYFPENQVFKRYEEFILLESIIMKSLEFTGRLH